MRIKKKNVARLASLSALGAGALGVAAGTAHAGVVYTPLSGKVGFNSPYGGWASARPSGGSAYFGVWRTWKTTYIAGGTRYRYLVNLQNETGQFLFRPADAAGGKKWGDLGSAPVASLTLGVRWETSHYWSSPPSSYGWSVTRGHSGTNGYFYKLFQFNAGSGDLFGWAYFHQTLNDNTGPNVDLLGMAYDTDGNQIGAGDTGSSVPEPSTMALAGLAALALGATGLRRWRGARKPAA